MFSHAFSIHHSDGRRLCALTIPGLLLALLLWSVAPVMAGGKTIAVPPPGPTDACPVCGMFPVKYPDWTATIVYKDGHAHHFDGAKDFFKYLLDMKKFSGGHKKSDIMAMAVTDYYATDKIDPRTAFYVIGSDVLGPMGHELVPHPDMYDAKSFMKDHKGKRILTFDEVTMPLLRGLDKGEFLLK